MRKKTNTGHEILFATRKNVRADEIKLLVENHQRAASYLDSAAQYHLEAARCHKEGEHEKAYQMVLMAKKNMSRANEIQEESIPVSKEKKKVNKPVIKRLTILAKTFSF